MKKYFTMLVCICMLALAGCSNSADNGEPMQDIGERAAEVLTDKLVSLGIMKSDMQMEGGECMVWENMGEREISGSPCYAFELRYSEDAEAGGEMAGRLFGNYAISKDGQTVYSYDSADDEWEAVE